MNTVEPDGDVEVWVRRLMSGEMKFRSPRGWRAVDGRLWKLKPYAWLRGVLARISARLAVLPIPKPYAIYHNAMGFLLCLWEGDSGYVCTNIMIPGTKIELLLHMHDNRVVGIKVWE